ncbi:MAG: hypothetical protein JWP87_4986 [Labilithrix sp.]|nr:hypothetical protein [Labilithrix sp.]
MTAASVALLIACTPHASQRPAPPFEVSPPLRTAGDDAAERRSESPPSEPTALARREPGPFDLPPGPRDEDPIAPLPPPLSLTEWAAASRASSATPAPASCRSYATRVAAAPGTSDIATALSAVDPHRRDALLVAVGESETDEKRVWLRALRADLAPVECADTIVDPFLGTFAQIETPVSNVLVGLSIAAKTARTAIAPPSMWGLRDNDKVKTFIAGPLRAWFIGETAAIDRYRAIAKTLSSYGQGIALVEIGLADLSVVARVRNALATTMPRTWTEDLRADYMLMLGDSLEKRRREARVALLGALANFAQVGVLKDARVDRARDALAKAFPERRVDMLDALMLPPRVSVPASTPVEVASQSVSTFWLGFVGADADSLEVLVRGVPQPTRAHHRAATWVKNPKLDAAYARTRFEMGRTYWRRVDYVEAAYAAYTGDSQDERLLYALSLSLAHAPAADVMMETKTPAALELSHTEALDVVATENGPRAGMAAFDAATLRSFSPPDGAAAAPYLRDVAARFRKAESLLADPADKRRARERAAELDR